MLFFISKKWIITGGVAERPNAPVLKTGDTKVSVGSNPTPSAIFLIIAAARCFVLKKTCKKNLTLIFNVI